MDGYIHAFFYAYSFLILYAQVFGSQWKEGRY